jgi:hypothetical protein
MVLKTEKREKNSNIPGSQEQILLDATSGRYVGKVVGCRCHLKNK